MLNVYYSDLPTKISLLNETMARMREQENAMNREAKHLESERIGLRRESARLEKERLALESTTLKMEGERRALESTIHHLEQERLRVEEKKRLLEAERSRLEKEKRLLENERQSLENERQSLERQESALKEERERWEKVRDELTIPRGAFWEVVWPAWDCRAYGRREYWGILRNIPEGRSEVDACMNMPVEIKGVTIRRPYRCQYVDGSIHGFWMVDWDQPDCKPWHQNFVDGVSLRIYPIEATSDGLSFKGCTNWGSGLRRIEAEVVGINDRGGQDWRLLCETTPMIWDHIVYTSPDHCLVSIPSDVPLCCQILTTVWRPGSWKEDRGLGGSRWKLLISSKGPSMPPISGVKRHAYHCVLNFCCEAST